MRTILASLLVLSACSGSTPSTPEAPKEAEKPVEKAPEPEPEPEAAAPTDAASFAKLSEEAQHAFLMEKGAEVYSKSTLACSTCHGAEGKGQPPAFPPLVGQKEHMGDCVRHAAIVIYGLKGELVVDGQTYNGVMTPQGDMLDDLQIAAVISYERNSWGNDYGWCSPEDVAKARKDNPL